MGELTSGAVIDIQAVRVSGGVLFKFRRADAVDSGLEVPLVKGVLVEKVNEKDVTCELTAADYVPLAEWNYTDVPFGFRKVACKLLDRGEYEILAYGYGANGRAHIKVEDNGSVTRTR